MAQPEKRAQPSSAMAAAPRKRAKPAALPAEPAAKKSRGDASAAAAAPQSADRESAATAGDPSIEAAPDAAAAPAHANGSRAVGKVTAPKKRSAKATNAGAKRAAPKKKTAAKSATAKSATAKSATAKPKKPAARRKSRTVEDRQKENAPMNLPFFVETGGEWNATDIDFDELATLRGLWELPAACHLLWLLQNPLTLRFSNTLLEYEAALLKPTDSPVLEDVFTKLLLKKSERDCLSAGIGLKYEWWNKQLRDYYMAMYDKWYALLRKAGERPPAETFSQDEDDTTTSGGSEGEEDDRQKADEPVDVELTDEEWLTLDILKARLEGLGDICPLKHATFAELPAELRCKILLNLCEAVIEDPVNTEYIRMMEDDDLRVEPLGNDRVGNLFYFFPQFYEERRIYRLDVATNQWALWAKGEDAFRRMLAGMKAIRGRKVRGEQELLDHLEVIVEQIEEEKSTRAKQLEKANRLAILEAMPRKRSLRLQVKQLEDMEKKKEEKEAKQHISEQEVAELKRAELLKKVEREAEREARQHEREAKKIEREQHEKEAADAERELRRQRRREHEIEQEQLALAAEIQQEKQRRQQEEARERRALQRQATASEEEDEEFDVGDVSAQDSADSSA